MQDKNIKSESKKNGSKKSERSRKKLPQKKKKKMDNGKMTRKSKRKTVNNKNRKFLSKCSPTTKCSNAGGFCKRTNYCLLKVGPNANSICKGLCTCCKETSSEFSFQHFGLWHACIYISLFTHHITRCNFVFFPPEQAENNCKPKKNCLGESQSCVIGKANCNGKFKKNGCSGKRCGCCTIGNVQINFFSRKISKSAIFSSYSLLFDWSMKWGSTNNSVMLWDLPSAMNTEYRIIYNTHSKSRFLIISIRQ